MFEQHLQCLGIILNLIHSGITYLPKNCLIRMFDNLTKIIQHLDTRKFSIFYMETVTVWKTKSVELSLFE